MSTAKDPENLRVIVWRDLPDPQDPAAPEGGRTEVILERKAWKHIVKKHVLSEKAPWADIFSEEVLRELGRAAAELRYSFSYPPGVQAVEALGRQVRAALERPLVLVYQALRVGSSKKRPHQRWVLILPSGAIVFIHQKGGKNRVATCYFPSKSSVIPHREARWRHVVKRYVLRYAHWSCQANAILLPTKDMVRVVLRAWAVKEEHFAIRFVTPATWGFCPELDGCPWRGRLDDWPGAEPTPRGRRRRLKPRRPPPPSEEEFS